MEGIHLKVGHRTTTWDVPEASAVSVKCNGSKPVWDSFSDPQREQVIENMPHQCRQLDTMYCVLSWPSYVAVLSYYVLAYSVISISRRNKQGRVKWEGQCVFTCWCVRVCVFRTDSNFCLWYIEKGCDFKKVLVAQILVSWSVLNCGVTAITTKLKTLYWCYHSQTVENLWCGWFAELSEQFRSCSYKNS